MENKQEKVENLQKQKNFSLDSECIKIKREFFYFTKQQNDFASISAYIESNLVHNKSIVLCSLSC